MTMTGNQTSLAAPRRSKPEDVPFTVDSALLRELGERLVGKPHIALAELVKNAYDADARNVTIRFERDSITVSDDGHGMTRDAFVDYWMRIGTRHKQDKRLSPGGRPLTGSKGVGRLAAQFLARRCEIQTVSTDELPLDVSVNWQSAIHKEFLTEVTAQLTEGGELPKLPGGAEHGARIVLRGLKQEWEDDSFRDLAREIWMLRPPFFVSGMDDRNEGMNVEFSSFRTIAKRRFDEQMGAVQDNWIARLEGAIIPSEDDSMPLRGRVHLSFTHRPAGNILAFSDRSPVSKTYEVIRKEVSEDDDGSTEGTVEKIARASDLSEASYDIRIFNLSNRQSSGLQLGDVREYLQKFGGVHIYDAGFHLPFYGVDTDWLDIERDHSHRISRSALLPEDLQVSRGLNDLPTNGRIFGVVKVDTGKERRRHSTSPAGDGADLAPVYLAIQISRDRLVDNRSFAALRDFVRYGIDFYASETARRKFAEAAKTARTVRPSIDAVQQLRDTVRSYRNQIPEPALEDITARLRQIEETRRVEATLETRRVGLLGALATAGITAIAYEHEVAKQLHNVGDIIGRLESIKTGNEDADIQLKRLSSDLRDYLQRTRATRALFTNVMNQENRESEIRLKAKVVVEETARQMGVLMRRTRVDADDVNKDLRLPPGSYAEWAAIFQNVLINSVNAMLDSPTKRIDVYSQAQGKTRDLVFLDTGSGVDLEDAEKLFAPFERRQILSEERRELGYGGTGLGLTIVRMIADGLGCKVAFVSPMAGYATALRIRWEEA